MTSPPLQLAQWAYVFWRFLVSPGAGLYLLLIDPKLSGMSAWQVPIVCGLLLFPIASPAAVGLGAPSKDLREVDQEGSDPASSGNAGE